VALAILGGSTAKYQSSEGLPIHERFVQTNGLRVRCLEYGSGRPLILMHSMGMHSWAEQFLAGADTWGRIAHVYAVDRPGWGLSETPAEYTFPMWIETIKGFCDALGLDQVDIGGTSIGGWFAALFAHQYPERVRRAVLMTNPGVNPWTGSFDSYRTPSLEAIRRNYDGLDPAIIDPILELLQDEERRSQYKKIVEYVGNPENREEWGLRTRLPEMTMPILFTQIDDNKGLGRGGVKYTLEQFMLAPLGRLFVATGYPNDPSGYNRYVNAFKDQVALFLTAYEIRPAK
jgi:pimeloyl-ACP methyl ester carboxylesterase